MDRVIVVTLIICITIVLVSIIRVIELEISRKRVMKNLNKFSKAFGVKDKSDDGDLPKFGGF